MKGLPLLIAISGLFAQLGYIEEGEASYYAPSFHGRRTASGEKYDRHALTAAHRTLPFGTYVRVTDKTTGRSVVVRINDRGPLKLSRVIDLSERAAQELGILQKGVALVRVEVTQPAAEVSPFPGPSKVFFDMQGRPVQPKGFAVQVGAFSEIANARVLAQNVQKEGKEPVFFWRTQRGKTSLYRVVVGDFSKRAEAERFRDRLKSEGWQAFVVHLSP
ncbi:MAG: hypothetical protein KatS3mg025_0375 [Bacteroidia bacterium]|jgi:rare lipoprotein A|nr:MAG: hypothetical protein KatS3mg025_0375 [Bacteroidia bacterium]